MDAATQNTMNLLRNMRVFVRVAEAGSFTAGAEQSDVTTAQASRFVSDLEVHLHAQLFNRTTRRIVWTDAGNRYLRRCKEILALIDASEAEAGEARTSPEGVLRIHAPLSFGGIYVVPALTRYLEKHPLVRAEVTLSPSEVPTLSMRGSTSRFRSPLRICPTPHSCRPESARCRPCSARHLSRSKAMARPIRCRSCISIRASSW